MKMKDVGPLIKAVTEQVNDPNAPDPFRPIPLPFVHDKSSAEEHEIQKLTAEKLHVEAKIKSLKAKVDSIISGFGAPHLGTYSQSSNPHVFVRGKKMKPAQGHIIVGDYDYDLSRFPQKTQNWLLKYGPILNALEARESAIERKIKSIKKEVDAAAVIAAATTAGLTTNASGVSNAPQVPIAQIPRKLGTSPNASNIDNPYFKSGEYAGPPYGYKFSTPMRTIYVSLEATLKRHGLTLGTLYVGRHGGAGGPINFVTATAGNKFVWRKYDAGGASGQNWIYLNGHQMKTSSFMSMTEPQRDAALKVNNVI